MTRIASALQRLQRQAQTFGNVHWHGQLNSYWPRAQCVERGHGASSARSPPHLRSFSAKSNGAQRRPDRDYDFVDRLRIQARGGQGGSGSVSLWRSSAKGKPSVHVNPLRSTLVPDSVHPCAKTLLTYLCRCFGASCVLGGLMLAWSFWKESMRSLVKNRRRIRGCKSAIAQFPVFPGRLRR